eukprot:2313153-Pyramimonas_sp.AAC.1
MRRMRRRRRRRKNTRRSKKRRRNRRRRWGWQKDGDFGILLAMYHVPSASTPPYLHTPHSTISTIR